MKGVILAAGALAAGWIAWPYWSVYSLAEAARARDVVTLEKRVNWNSVRAGLRDDFKAAMMAQLAKSSPNKSNDGNAFAVGLSAMLGPVIVDRMLDAFVTPQGIGYLIENGRLQQKDGTTPINVQTPPRGNVDWVRVNYAFFSGLTEFRLDITDKDKDSKMVMTVLFRWDGDWKLSRIFLPAEFMK